MLSDLTKILADEQANITYVVYPGPSIGTASSSHCLMSGSPAR